MKKIDKESAEKAYGRLIEILEKLRGPDGCPWDKKQTASSLRHNLIEESYELIEAIDSGDSKHEKEEIGDMFFLTLMIAEIEEENGKFTITEALNDVTEKLIRRHPHVFGENKLHTADEVLIQWKEIKETVEGREKRDSILDRVSRALPPLERSLKLQKEAKKVGFDWKEIKDVRAKVEEELKELEEVAPGNNEKRIEEEIGDLLFSIINLCRFYSVDPSTAVHKANEKFARRFRAVEKIMNEKGITMNQDNFEIMDGLWNDVKSREPDL